VGLDQVLITRLLTAGAGDQKADRVPGHARGLDEQILAFQCLKAGRKEDIVVSRLTEEAISVVRRVIKGLCLEPVEVVETLHDPSWRNGVRCVRSFGRRRPGLDAVVQQSLVRGCSGLVIELVSGAVLVYKPQDMVVVKYPVTGKL